MSKMDWGTRPVRVQISDKVAYRFAGVFVAGLSGLAIWHLLVWHPVGILLAGMAVVAACCQDGIRRDL